jgi:hypothetical protein
MGALYKQAAGLEAAEATRTFLNSFGTNVLTMTPDEGQEFLKRPVKDWEAYVRLANIPKN